jgi:hypothetical protein
MLDSWGKRLGVGQQSVGLRIQIVLGPSGGNNLGTEGSSLVKRRTAAV